MKKSNLNKNIRATGVHLKVQKTPGFWRLLFAFVFIFGTWMTSSPIFASHLIGGELSYQCAGPANGNTGIHRYLFTLKVVRDIPGGSDFDGGVGGNRFTVSVYQGSDTRPFSSPSNFNLVRSPLKPDPNNACVLAPPVLQLEQGTYTFTLDLEVSNQSWFIVYQVCCRAPTLSNVVNPLQNGATHFIEITPEAQRTCNSSPQFKVEPPSLFCTGVPFIYDHSATDQNGDSLVYSLGPVFIGGGPSTNPATSRNGVAPDPDAPPNLAATFPYDTITFRGPNFSSQFPLGRNANLRIDPRTGIITGTPMITGQFVFTIMVREFRQGRLMSTTYRQLQLSVVNCQKLLSAKIAADSVRANGTQVIRTCRVSNLVLRSTSSGGTQIKNYRWRFSTPTGPISRQGAADTTFRVDFGTPGIYNGFLILNPGDACTDSVAIQVLVLAPLQAAMAPVLSTCQAGPIQLRNTSILGTGDALRSLNWDLGNGRTSTDASPQVTYDKAGSYLVKLDIRTTSGCQDTISQRINYFPTEGSNLNIRATIAPLDLCLPNAQINASLSLPAVMDVPGYRIEWEWGDGSSAIGKITSKAYTTPGVFPVTYRVIAPQGTCQLERKDAANQIRVGIKPVAKFSFSPVDNTPRNRSFNFLDESTDANSWAWDFGSRGGAGTPTASFQFPGGGKYVVKLRVSNGACRDSTTQTINIETFDLYYVPNVFSPNDDGSNEVFNIYGVPGNASEFVLRIFSRWGQLVHETSDPATGWNGRLQNAGDQVVSGTYLYVIRFKDEAGNLVNRAGELNLLR